MGYEPHLPSCNGLDMHCKELDISCQPQWVGPGNTFWAEDQQAVLPQEATANGL